MDSADPRESDGLCGRELVPEFPQEGLAEEYDPETWYEDEEGTHYCCREVLDRADDDRCIWHADIADKPADALAAARSEEPARLDRAILRQSDLRDVTLSGCRLPVADLSGANLQDADLTHMHLANADFSDADLMDAELVEAYIYNANLNRTYSAGADFSEANLEESRLSDAMLRGADLTDAILERADFTRVNLFDADLTGAKLYGAVLADVQLNTDTEFGDHYTDESHNPDPDKAAWTLRQLERLFRDNALPCRARAAYLDRKDRRRRQYWAETKKALWADDPVTDRLRTAADRAAQWARTALYGATMRYGESPRRVVGVSVLMVFAFGVVYPFFGGIDAGGEASTNYGFEPIVAGVDGLPAPVVDVLANLYFSAVTFTTLGYGDIQPATPVVELLATVESFVGALLMALLVFVLGRRATW